MDNYELIRMLIEGDTLTFRDRLQSFIEQLPDNKRSVNKEGFFPLFVLGGFLALPDTELGESLGVKQVFFRVEKYKKNNKSYVNGVKFAILIKEQNKKDKLLFIVVYEKNPIVFDRKEVEYIKSKLNSHDTEETWHSIQIKHEDKVGIVVYDKCDDDLFPDKSASHKGELFVLKKRTEEKNLEELISKCFLLDVDKVSSGIKGVFDYFDSLVQDYIIEESGNFDHESDYHGLLSGFFIMLFKYRYNLKLYPELSLGEGYSDIVVLVRSQERLNNVIPIIVELKAGKDLAIQGDPFEQAKKYAEAFKYGPRRMITNNNNVIYAVLNFDLPRDRIKIGTTARDSQHLSPFLQLLLESGDKDIIYEQLKYLYYTIPNLSDNYYMYTSKMLLGELMPAKAGNGIWDKCIFQHEKDISNHITSFGFLNSGKNQLVLLNVIRSDSRSKKINIDKIIEEDEEVNVKLNMDELIQNSRNLKIKEVNLLLETKKANIGKFENWCRKVQVNSYSNLDDYNEKKTQIFDGKCVNLDVDVNKLNGLLNKVVGKKVDGAQSHNAEHHIELLKKISEILFPFKELIDSEVDFQAMLHGLLMYHQESTSSKKLVGVISEVQTGGGKRIDIGVVGGEIFTGIELKFDKTKGIVSEGEELTTKAKEAESQLERYKKQPNNIKSLIDSEGARLFWAVFHRGANEPELLIETRSEFYTFQLDHSSMCLLSSSLSRRKLATQEEDYFPLIMEGCLYNIELLLSKGNNTEVKDNHGCTPLHYAAKCSKLDIVNLLYTKGANIKAKNKNGKMPLDFINLFLKGSGKDIKNSDKDWPKSWKPLHYAAYNGNVGIVQEMFELLLKESNNDINVRDGKYEYAPLHVAVYYNRTGMVKFLLDKNADIEAKDKYGYTPLHHAIRYSTLNMTRLLCEKGANIKAKNKKGEIPLCIADQYGKVDIIDFLLSKDATIEASDFNDNTVLKLAYCIKGLMDKTNNNLPPSFEGLESKLPKSVKNLVFAPEVCITSVYSNEYLYAAADRLNYDKERRRVFTWIPSKKNNPPGSCSDDKQGMWKVQPYGDNLCITSVYNSNEYLYAAADRLNYDKERRRVFTWIPSKKNNPPGSCSDDKQGMWKVQPYGDNLCITSVYSNEYLYAAADRLNYDKERRRVFTWIPSKKNNPPGSCGCDKQGMWKVEDRGSIRKRRDIQELESKMSLNSGLYVDVNITDKNHSSRKLLAVDLSNQPEIAISSGTRPSSWINDLFSWVKSSVGGLFYSRAALSEEASNTASSIPQVDEQFAKASVSSSSSTSTTLPSDGTDKKQENGGFFRDNIDYVNANIKQMRERQTPVKFKPSGGNTILEMGDHYLSQVDFNGTIMLLDLLIRKVTGQKYISTVDQSISPLEAQGYALNITKEFEKVVEQAAKDSKISMHRLNIDFVKIQKEVTGKIMGGKFNEILGILNSYVEKACPGREAGCPGRLSPKKFDKFITEFNNKLDVALNQSMQQISHSRNSTLEVSEVKEQQISLEPRSYLNNTSVQGHLAQGRDLRLR